MSAGSRSQVAWNVGGLRELGIDEIGQVYGRYRLRDQAQEIAMLRSFKRYGQITPVIVCLRDGNPELIDGFKRLAAARALHNGRGLVARLVEVDDRLAKAAIYALNRGGGRTCELEEAWIIHALVREDG